eukprot:g26841.t1
MISSYKICNHLINLQVEQEATYDDQEVPKAKHVKHLIELTQPPHSSQSVVSSLIRRLKNCQYWNEVTKTLIVIHMICSDARPGASGVMSSLATSPSIFSCVEKFEDKHDIHTKGHSKYALEYAQYLNAKVESYMGLGRSIEQLPPSEVLFSCFSFTCLLVSSSCLHVSFFTLGSFFTFGRKDEKWPASLSKDRLMVGIPLLLHQIEDGIRCRPFTWNGLCHVITAHSADILYKDMVRIWATTHYMFKELLKFKDQMERKELLEAAKWGERMKGGNFESLMGRLMSIGVEKPKPAKLNLAEEAAAEFRTEAGSMATSWNSAPQDPTPVSPVLRNKVAAGARAKTPKASRPKTPRANSVNPKKAPLDVTSSPPGTTLRLQLPAHIAQQGGQKPMCPNLTSGQAESPLLKDDDHASKYMHSSLDAFDELVIDTESSGIHVAPPKTVGAQPNRDPFSFLNFDGHQTVSFLKLVI